jgi:hypothetical protein
MTEYTPSPTKVRKIYKDFGVGPTPARRMDEFDRMIREVRAEAWEEGYETGWETRYGTPTVVTGRPHDPDPNPYRTKEQP